MGSLLFSPSGRIGPSEFMKGMMVLALISALISLTGFVSFQISQMLGFASLLLVIPVFFLLIKRSHDAGRSGWMSIVWFILFLIIWLAIAYLFSKVMPSTSQVEMETAMEALVAEGGGLSDILALTNEYGPAVAKEAALPSAISSLIGTGAAAFVINMLNKSDPDDNQFGPAS